MAADYFEIDPQHAGGEPRFIGGAFPSDGDPQKLNQVFGDVGDQILIPKEKWEPVTLERFLPPVKNQNGLGACNAFDSITNLECGRAQAGLAPYVELSGGDLYRRICGGRDQGSLPEDGLHKLMTEGVTTALTTPPLDWTHDRGTSAERMRYRILEAYWCPTLEHAISALMQGFFLNTNIFWYKNDPVGPDGKMRDHGSGSKGGHSIPGYGVEFDSNGKPWILFQNQWTTAFGINGRAKMAEARAREGTQVFKWWATRAVVQESGDLPTPTF